MTPRALRSVLTVCVAAVVASAASGADKAPAKKKVLVELYESQGCDMCPKADLLLGDLKGLGFGPDQIVPISFHVDYFDTPWKDRFSDPNHSKREMSYNTALNRDDLYFTPMLMVDGRYPMLGSDQPKALEALKRATADKPGASLSAVWKAGSKDPRKRTLEVNAGILAGSPAAGREVMVGVALYEDGVETDVKSGENQGKHLIERFAVRKFVWERFKLDRPKTMSFPLGLGSDWNAAKCGAAVWVQDWSDGRVYQADRASWPDGPSH